MPADNSLLTWDQVHDPIDLSVQLFFFFFFGRVRGYMARHLPK